MPPHISHAHLGLFRCFTSFPIWKLASLNSLAALLALSPFLTSRFGTMSALMAHSTHVEQTVKDCFQAALAGENLIHGVT